MIKKVIFAIRRTVLWILISFFCVSSLFPVFWTFITSIKQRKDFFGFPPKIFFEPTLVHYITVFEKSPFLNYFKNSLIVASGSTILALLLGSLAGFSLARFKFRNETFLMTWILSMYMIPPLAIIVPLFLIYRSLGLYDTLFGLILAHTSFNLPIVIWLTSSYFRRMPKSIEEAALIDGCSYFQAFYKIVLPISLPVLSSSAILSFIFSWNEFAFSKFLTGEFRQTLPAGTSFWLGSKGIDWGALSATGFLIIIPMVIFIFFAQRGLIYGLTFGATKE